MIETIKHAAVKSEDGWIFIGKCHADCLHKMHHINVPYGKGAENQGFITSKGRFVSRSEAAKLALDSDQIDKHTPLLFSENLWSKMYEGKYSYCNIKGYVLRVEDIEPETSDDY